MKVLIVSDTHRNEDNLIEVLEREKNLDLLIHCGDVEGAEDEIEHYAGCNTVFVAGNNDFFSSLEKEQLLTIKGKKIFLTHGHKFNPQNQSQSVPSYPFLLPDPLTFAIVPRLSS